MDKFTKDIENVIGYCERFGGFVKSFDTDNGGRDFIRFTNKNYNNKYQIWIQCEQSSWFVIIQTKQGEFCTKLNGEGIVEFIGSYNDTLSELI